jgi:ATP-binding cassette subfamily A (ABC1) protein 3
MKMTGIPNWMHWVGWMMNSLVVLIVSITVVSILFFVTFASKSGAVFTFTDPTLWWFFMFIYIIWATTHCFLVSSFFTRRKRFLETESPIDKRTLHD